MLACASRSTNQIVVARKPKRNYLSSVIPQRTWSRQPRPPVKRMTLIAEATVVLKGYDVAHERSW